jgi:hypothetical protein
MLWRIALRLDPSMMRENGMSMIGHHYRRIEVDTFAIPMSYRRQS